MVATQNRVSFLHEVWTELVALNGGASEAIATNLPYDSVTDTNAVDVIFTPNTIVGNPVFTFTFTETAAGLLSITIANTAAPGNQAQWVMDVHLQHTIIR